MELKTLLDKSRAAQRAALCLPRMFGTAKFRMTIMGSIIGLTIMEVTMYLLLKNSAIAGDIPTYGADVVLVCVSATEILLGPFVSWVGYWKPRATLILWHVVAVIVVTPLFVIYIPEVNFKDGSELCTASYVPATSGLTAKSIITLIALIVMGIIGALTRIGIWSNGLAYLHRLESNRMSLHFSVLVMMRVMTIILGKYLVKEMIPSRVWLQALAVLIPAILKLMNLLIFHLETSEIKQEFKARRDFSSTMQRVLTNKLAMVQIVGIALLATGLWGFTLCSDDIVKVKYHQIPAAILENNIAALLQILLFVIFIVVFYGLQNSSPTLPEFCVLNAVRRTIKFSIFLGLLYLTLGLIKCDKAPMAGLSAELYTQPTCSQQCGCTVPWDQFSPVCDVTTMTTYVSRCHAGCSTHNTLHHIKYYKNCTCASTYDAIMTAGACSVHSCELSYQLQNFLFTLAITITLLGFQSLGVVMLHAVDPRDKAVAFGVLSATVSLFAGVGGHLTYLLGISGTNCAWSEGGTCLLQNSRFPVVVGSTSSGLAFLSAVISLLTYFLLKRRKNKAEVLNCNVEY